MSADSFHKPPVYRPVDPIAVAATPESDRWLNARRSREDDAPLSHEAILWLQSLPPAMQPGRTARRYPRILNRLARFWSRPVACNAYFEELVIDLRGSRRGFPDGIGLELALLKNYYQTMLHPTPQTVWDDVLTRARRLGERR